MTRLKDWEHSQTLKNTAYIQSPPGHPDEKELEIPHWKRCIPDLITGPPGPKGDWRTIDFSWKSRILRTSGEDWETRKFWTKKGQKGEREKKHAKTSTTP